MDVRTIEGLGPEKQPYPLPEFAFGNVVKLKEPIRDRSGRIGTWGVIVTHTSRSAFSEPAVQLMVYDDDGRMLIEENHVPMFLEFHASEFLLWHLADAVGSELIAPQGFDLYPDCEACNASGNAPSGGLCPACAGSGHVKEMRRLPPR